MPAADYAWQETLRDAWRDARSVFAEHARRCGPCAPTWQDPLFGRPCEPAAAADSDFDGLPDICDYDDDNDADYDRTDPQPYDPGVFLYAPGKTPRVPAINVLVVGQHVDLYA
jgi:hypothetical protein